MHFLANALLALAAVTIVAPGSPALAGQRVADGTLLSSEPCPPNPIRSHADYVQAVREELRAEANLAREEGLTMPPVTEDRLRLSLESRDEVGDHIAYRGFECRVITYSSGGLRVSGLLWKPIDTAGKRLPLIIALRGGNQGFGGMEPWRYWGWHDFLKAGYVVLATQYRGGPGSEGKDGYGSSGDLSDVENLIPLARSLGYVDTDQVFAHGGSRGGMQLYMLARSGFPLRAMAVRAGMANMRRTFATRRYMERDLVPLMLDYPSDPEAALDRRSAALWAHELKVPAIMFHGTSDWRGEVQDTIDVAAGYHRSRTPFEVHLYEGDTHALELSQADMVRRTIEFFQRYRLPARISP